MDYEAVLQEVVAWAGRQDNIRAAVLTGSLARGEGAFDHLSDLDIELYVSDPIALLGQTAWYEQFGEVLLVEALPNPGWHPTRLVYYADGKIDFMIAATAALADPVFYERPFRLLLDKDNRQRLFRRRPARRASPPARSEFLESVHAFYAATVMWAKCLVRDDPWSAKVRDWDSKKQLLKMVEWHSKARTGWELETWSDGAHLKEWADREVVSQLEECWSGFSYRDSVRGLRMSVSLFEALSSTTATSLGLAPFDSSRVREQIDRILDRSDLPQGQRLPDPRAHS